jgi:hypothetical protein
MRSTLALFLVLPVVACGGGDTDQATVHVHDTSPPAMKVSLFSSHGDGTPLADADAVIGETTGIDVEDGGELTAVYEFPDGQSVARTVQGVVLGDELTFGDAPGPDDPVNTVTVTWPAAPDGSDVVLVTPCERVEHLTGTAALIRLWTSCAPDPTAKALIVATAADGTREWTSVDVATEQDARATAGAWQPGRTLHVHPPYAGNGTTSYVEIMSGIGGLIATNDTQEATSIDLTVQVVGDTVDGLAEVSWGDCVTMRNEGIDVTAGEWTPAPDVAIDCGRQPAFENGAFTWQHPSGAAPDYAEAVAGWNAGDGTRVTWWVVGVPSGDRISLPAPPASLPALNLSARGDVTNLYLFQDDGGYDAIHARASRGVPFSADHPFDASFTLQ